MAYYTAVTLSIVLVTDCAQLHNTIRRPVWISLWAFQRPQTRSFIVLVWHYFLSKSLIGSAAEDFDWTTTCQQIIKGDSCLLSCYLCKNISVTLPGCTEHLEEYDNKQTRCTKSRKLIISSRLNRSPLLEVRGLLRSLFHRLRHAIVLPLVLLLSFRCCPKDITSNQFVLTFLK